MHFLSYKQGVEVFSFELVRSPSDEQNHAHDILWMTQQ